MSPCDDGYVSVYIFISFHMPAQSVTVCISLHFTMCNNFLCILTCHDINCVIYEEPKNVEGLEFLHERIEVLSNLMAS